MPKMDYYEEVKKLLGEDFFFGDVGEVMVEIADRLKQKIAVAEELLREVREKGIFTHSELRYGCDECAYVASSLCGRIGTFLGET